MSRGARELWAALAAILIITLIYLGVILWRGSIPAASQFFGHSLGAIGLLLMLMTETLYSIRKRSRIARWGRMMDWLQFHIFTGLVGPYLALLHTSWKFNGLAGVVILLTIVIVISGFIGRYIYTAVPRTVDGVEIETAELNELISSSETELENWLKEQTDEIRQRVRGLITEVSHPSAFALVFGRSLDDLRFRREWHAVRQSMDRQYQSQAQSLESMLVRRQALRRQVASLSVARRLLSVWHSVHIPIGMALFTLAFIHMGAALYYATLMR